MRSISGGSSPRGSPRRSSTRSGCSSPTSGGPGGTVALRLEAIRASYGPIEVLFGIDLEVADGEIVALLGTNGAGKTTVLRVISGLLKPSSGTLTWNGESLVGVRPPDIVKRGVGQMRGGRGLFPGMGVPENPRMAGVRDGKDTRKKKTRSDGAL